jgi:hypothetical protein
MKGTPVFRSPVVILFLVVIVAVRSEPQADPGSEAQSARAKLPGKGLAQHDFMYVGESHARRIFVIRQGKVVWSYDDLAGKGEISDAVMLSNGNILFTHQYGVTEITRLGLAPQV